MNDLSDLVRDWRHHLHRHPELAFAEHRTAAFVADTLGSFDGVEVATGIGGTGVVGSLTCGDGPGVIGLRADMDCLPLTETGAHDHRSTQDGAMHACGHDGHMAMLLGAAATLAREGGFDGTVRFLFQPAEEPGRGARAMLDDGVFERFGVDAVYGLHNIPGIPAGHLRTRVGPIMGAEDNFEIRIAGRGGHASAPHLLVDPIVVAAEIVLALQTIVSRAVPPEVSAVVSCTEIVTDGARNAVPSSVVVRGDTRNFTPETRALLEKRIRQITEGVCAAHGASCEVTYSYEFDPTVNDQACVDAAAAAAVRAVGAENVDTDTPPIMASEDFGLFAREVPGCFAFIGNGTEPGRGGTPLHSHDYDFNDDILDAGVRYYVELVRSLLPVTR